MPNVGTSRGGFTLVEALLASVILAGAISAMVWPFAAGGQQELDAARRSLAADLAKDLVEEILSKPFDDPDSASSVGPESGETSRALFDNIDDYHGLREPAGGICSIDGLAVTSPEASHLSRQTEVAYVYVSGQDDSEPPSFVSIRVEVLYRGQQAAVVNRLVYQVQ